jgi:hypothetical protein
MQQLGQHYGGCRYKSPPSPSSWKAILGGVAGAATLQRPSPRWCKKLCAAPHIIFWHQPSTRRPPTVVIAASASQGFGAAASCGPYKIVGAMPGWCGGVPGSVSLCTHGKSSGRLGWAPAHSDDDKKIMAGAQTTRLVSSVKTLPTSNVADVWDRATNAEREEMAPVALKKMEAFRKLSIRS